jgi:hypothetical protein
MPDAIKLNLLLRGFLLGERRRHFCQKLQTGKVAGLQAC